MRTDKTNYYLDIAETVAQRSTCIRCHYGAIIVKNDEIVSTGYNGAPRGRKNCIDIGSCFRTEHNIPHGTRYESCRSCHGEQNAIISASRNDMLGATLYLTGLDAKTNAYMESIDCCSMCKRMIINAGIATVIIRQNKDSFRTVDVNDWIENDDSLTLHDSY
ncbi:MAG: cytidine deaminase [Clostridia bacterium]|nr:cytidine deaminase [Clostridia bacterium]